MSNESLSGDAEQGGDIDVSNPIERRDRFEIISSDLDQFMAEQDDPQWRLSILGEWVQMTGQVDRLDVGGDLQEVISKGVEQLGKYIQQYHGGRWPTVLRYLVDSLPTTQDEHFLRVAAAILSNRLTYSKCYDIMVSQENRKDIARHILHGSENDAQELFRKMGPRIDNPSVYAFSDSEATLKSARDFSNSKWKSWRPLGGGQVVRWPEGWWREGRLWWGRTPDNPDRVDGLLQNQSLVVDLSMGEFGWDENRQVLELCRSKGISHILTGKVQGHIYAHHFVRDASQ